MTSNRGGLASRAMPFLAFYLLLAAPSALATFQPNFGFYPKDAQSCLNASAKASKCSGDKAADLNACLCSNGGGFVIRSARCLGKNDNKDVGNVYDTMADACTNSGTPLKISKTDFVGAAKDAADKDDDDDDDNSSSTTTTATASKTSSSSSAKTPSPTSSSSPSPTTSSTASSTPSPDNGKEGDGKKKLSTAGTIGIAVGVSIAGVAAIVGLALFLVRRRKRSNAADEAHPMLAREKYGGPTTYPPHDPSPSLGASAGGFDHETKSHYSASTTYGGAQQQPRHSYAALSNPSPDPQQHNFLSAWEPPAAASSYSTSPSNSQYVGPYAAPQGVAELPPQTQPASNVFELDAHGVAAPPPPPPPPQAAQQPPREYRPYVPR